MTSPLFIWLGAGRARRRHVAERGQLLDQAARAGLPIPPGAILLDELLRVFIDKGLIQHQDDRLVVADPELFYNTLFYSVRLPRFERPVRLRPAFDPGPGVALGHDRVDFGDDVATAAALSAIWTALERLPAGRADVLVLEEVAAEYAGVALIGGATDEVTLTRGDATDLPPTLPRLSAWAVPEDALPPFARRLQMLLRGARRTFGRGLWQVEWADDGRICYLIGAAAGSPPPPTA